MYLLMRIERRHEYKCSLNASRDLFCTEFSVVSWFLQLVPWCSLHSALKKATVPRITKDMSPMKTNRLLCGLILLAIKSFSFLNESHKPTHRGTNA